MSLLGNNLSVPAGEVQDLRLSFAIYMLDSIKQSIRYSAVAHNAGQPD